MTSTVLKNMDSAIGYLVIKKNLDQLFCFFACCLLKIGNFHASLQHAQTTHYAIFGLEEHARIA
jgi:hypothetical protein